MQNSNPSSQSQSVPFPFSVDEPSDRLALGELLDVLRGPTEWVFTLAERRTRGDLIDLEAIHRVRDAVRARLASATTGGTTTEPRPRIRATDVLTVAGLLVGTLDPVLVQRAALGIGGGIVDGAAAMLRLNPSLTSYAIQTVVASFAGARVPHPVTSSNEIDNTPAPATPCAGPSIPRAAVPPWHCPHGHVAL